MDPWASQAEQAVINSILSLKQAADHQRIADAETLDDFFCSTQREQKYLKPRPKETAEHYNSRIHFTVDWANFFLNAISDVYTYGRGPTRTIEPMLPIWKTFQSGEIWRDPRKQLPRPVPLNQFMKYADKWTRCHGYGLVETRFVQRGEPIQLLYYKPQQFTITQSQHDPLQLDTVRVLTNAQADSVTSNVTMVYHYWTREIFAVHDQNGNILTGSDGKKLLKKNPYGFIPFVPIWDRPTFYDFYVEGMGKKIMDACLSINQTYDFLIDAILHLFGQLVWTGEVEEKNRIRFLSPDNILYAGNGDAKRIPPNFPIGDIISGIGEMAKATAMSVGVSPGAVDFKVYEARDPSSLAIEASKTGPADDREVRVQLFEQYERDIVNYGSHVYETETGEHILPETYQVSFPTSPSTSMTADARREDVRLWAGEGWIDPVDAILEMRPGMARAQAEEWVARAKLQKRGGAEPVRAGRGVEVPVGDGDLPT